MPTVERMAAGRVSTLKRIVRPVKRFATLLAIWRERARSRRALQQLDDAILRDIGLTRREVVQESRKPFWRA